MPIVATAVPKTPVEMLFTFSRSACSPSTNATTRPRPTVIAVTAVVSKPTAVPMMMFVAEPVLLACAISCTGRQAPAV
jgi:hypothetical protein